MLGYTLYKLYTSHTFNEYFNCHHFPPKETYNPSNILNHLLKTIIYMYAFFGVDKTHQNITHPRFCSENQPSCVLVSTFRAWLLGRWVGGSVQAHQEKDAKAKDAEEVKPGAVPAYLLDREQVRRTKVWRVWRGEGRRVTFFRWWQLNQFFIFYLSWGFMIQFDIFQVGWNHHLACVLCFEV